MGTRIRFVLYRGYDEDLMGLYQLEGARNFGILVRDALRVLIHPGYVPRVSPPEQIPHYSGEARRLPVGLNLLEETDEDILGLLSHIRPRKMGQFLKLSVRFYVGRFACLNTLLDTPVEVKKVYCTEGEAFLFTGMRGQPEKAAPEEKEKPEEKKPKKAKRKTRAEMPEYPQGFPQYPYPFYPYPVYGMPYGTMPQQGFPQGAVPQTMPGMDAGIPWTSYPQMGIPAVPENNPQDAAGTKKQPVTATPAQTQTQMQAPVQPVPKPEDEQPTVSTGPAEEAVQDVPAEDAAVSSIKSQEGTESGVAPVPQALGGADGTATHGGLSLAEPVGADYGDDELLALLEGMM